MAEGTVYIMVGYPASGKTTWAKAQEGFVRIDGDSLKTVKKMVAAAFASGAKKIIFDSTGGTVERRAAAIQFAKARGLTPVIVWLQTSIARHQFQRSRSGLTASALSRRQKLNSLISWYGNNEANTGFEARVSAQLFRT